MHTSHPRLRLVTALSLAPFVRATDFPINNENDLRAALAAGGGAGANDNIVFNTDITLTAELPAVQRSANIRGNSHTLSGNKRFRGFFVAAFQPGTGTPVALNVSINALTIRDTVAKGGNGSPGVAPNATGAGGGAGMGGSLFVGAKANVTLSGVTIAGSSAVGGNGGSVSTVGGIDSRKGSGGGGGLGGDGSQGSYSTDKYGNAFSNSGGGGGIGLSAIGGSNVGATGAAGIVVGAASGGRGLDGGVYGIVSAGGAGGAGGGGGGAGGTQTSGGGGGVAGGNASGLGGNIRGGDGGFGGGGGGGGSTSSGGNGGFGGGGGGGLGNSSGTWNLSGGYGGFGGGGGGGYAGGVSGNGCGAGFGGGSGSLGSRSYADNDHNTDGGGGGGAGLGGAIFVQDGGALQIADSGAIAGNSAAGGVGGSPGGGNGSAFGAGIFLQGAGGKLTLAPGLGKTILVADVIADQSGGGGTGGGAGNFGLSINGNAGVVVLTAANTFSGGVVVTSGVLLVANSSGSATGPGDVKVLPGAGVGGSGTIAGNLIVQSGGRITAGYQGAGSLHVGGTLTWAGVMDTSAVAAVTLSNTDNSCTQIIVNGPLIKGSVAWYTFNFQNTGSPGKTYTLMKFSGTTFTPGDFGSYGGLPPGLIGVFGLTPTALTFTVVALK